ncbi:hypothetical protein [Burkholderia contaminans]|uniref:hypothetical protein n=1 Tax=Burkholderia contaminans TaxID=488447 RepID=UPI00158B837C|nr:hypothetical protein [Burkholderia contaminans]
MMATIQNPYFIAEDEGTAFFFVKVLTTSILKDIKLLCNKLGLSNFVIQGYISTVEDSHFVKVEKKQ